jgi:hypothetical protein
MHEIADILRRLREPLAAVLMLGKISEMLKHITLTVDAKHHIDSQFLGKFLGRELGITARHDHVCPGIPTHEFVYCLTALLLGLLGDSATVYDANVCNLATLCSAYAGILQLTLDCCRFGKIELATKRIIHCFLIFENRFIYHCFLDDLCQISAKIAPFFEIQKLSMEIILAQPQNIAGEPNISGSPAILSIKNAPAKSRRVCKICFFSLIRRLEPNPCPHGQWILRLLNF